MKCPHCTVEINPNFIEDYYGEDSDAHWSVFYMTCPNPRCARLILRLTSGVTERKHSHESICMTKIDTDIFVRPLTSSRPPVPKEVDKKFSEDYKEACLTLSLSQKASAALSRRCLQNVLREKAAAKHSNLANEIQEVIDSGKLPSHLADDIDAVRNIGNFAAHPIKSTSTGEVIEVEEGEAEWLLDVSESLFDFYFVQPAKSKAKRDALNKKLTDAAKPNMK